MRRNHYLDSLQALLVSNAKHINSACGEAFPFHRPAAIGELSRYTVFYRNCSKLPRDGAAQLLDYTEIGSITHMPMAYCEYGTSADFIRCTIILFVAVCLRQV
jgi:hypothetical protein